jgi:hypothetical protein
LRTGRPLVALKITPLLIVRNSIRLTVEVFLIFVGLIIHELLLVIIVCELEKLASKIEAMVFARSILFDQRMGQKIAHVI